MAYYTKIGVIRCRCRIGGAILIMSGFIENSVIPGLGDATRITLGLVENPLSF